jgi:hypothetical protein
MKIENVKARKLKRKDEIVIGGVKHKIVSLNLHFGGAHERVSIMLQDPNGDINEFPQRVNLSVSADSRFTINRKK